MKVVIELPTWLGDTVMATEALTHICKAADEVVLVGSAVATQAVQNFPKVSEVFVDTKKYRPLSTLALAKKIGRADLALSFRSHIFSKLLVRLVGKRGFWYDKRRFGGHQVQMYHQFVESVFGQTLPFGQVKLYYPPTTYAKPTIGINPGATYGDAKRWYPEYFAQVIEELGPKYEYIIFGGPGEEAIAKAIEERVSFPIKNLAGKTTIPQLISHIAGLHAFLTNDSGPMHVAAAYDVPTIALFGPTNATKTSPFSQKARIVRIDIECAPCMKRTCPLKHHKCMKELTPQLVVQKLKEII